MIFFKKKYGSQIVNKLIFIKLREKKATNWIVSSESI